MKSSPKSLLHSSTDLAWLMEVLEVSEEEIVSVALSARSPYQPGSFKQKLKGRQKEEGRDPDAVPSTHELWLFFERADFRCTRGSCRSQLTVTIDRIDPKRGTKSGTCASFAGTATGRLAELVRRNNP